MSTCVGAEAKDITLSIGFQSSILVHNRVGAILVDRSELSPSSPVDSKICIGVNVYILDYKLRYNEIKSLILCIVKGDKDHAPHENFSSVMRLSVQAFLYFLLIKFLRE